MTKKLSMHMTYINKLYNIQFSYNPIIHPKDIDFNKIKIKCKHKQEYYTLLMRIFYLEYKTVQRKYKKIKQNHSLHTESSKNSTTSDESNESKESKESKESTQLDESKESDESDESDDSKESAQLDESKESDESGNSTDDFNFNTSSNINDKINNLLDNKKLYKKNKTIKKIFKKICIITHPDKTINEFYHYLFIKTKKAFEKKEYYKILIIAKILNIKIYNNYFDSITEKILMNEIYYLNETTNRMRASI